MKCNTCGSANLRRSTIYFADLPRLLLLQRPVRCRTCRERRYAGIFSVGKLHRVERRSIAARPTGEPKRSLAARRRRSQECITCGSANLRRSTIHFADLPRLLLLQRPVRCRTCRERRYAGIFSVGKLHRVERRSIAARPTGEPKRSLAARRRRSQECITCGSANLRRSTIHFADLPRLLLLQRPVRCRTCRDRHFAGIFSVGKLPSSARSSMRRSDMVA